MPSTQQEMQHLQELHARAIHQLSRKMSCIPAHVFPNGRKPTITDIYTANESAICIPSIPPELQLPSVLTHYDKLAAAKFTVDASQGATPINLALWYWGMDQTHSFSRKHRQMRYNIVMACIVRTSPDLSAHLPSSALDFADALINAWIWSVSQQDDFEAQAHFLGLWADGPWDVMLIGRKDRARMEVAARAMSQFVPKLDPLGGDIEYWEGLRYTSPWKLSTFGPAWAIRYIVDVEQLGKKIGEKGQEAEVEEALATGALEAGFSSMGLQQAPSYLSEELFAQPLVQALLSEDEDVDMEMEEAVDAASEEKEMWLDPAEAIAILEGTNEKYEKMKDLFSKVVWS